MISSSKLKKTAGAVICLALCILSGCATPANVVYLGDGTTQTVRLRKTAKRWPVWVKDSTGAILPAVMDLKDGGYFRNNLTK